MLGISGAKRYNKGATHGDNKRRKLVKRRKLARYQHLSLLGKFCGSLYISALYLLAAYFRIYNIVFSLDRAFFNNEKMN